MYQNYSNSLNPLEEHFSKQETISKGKNIMDFIATFIFGFLIGIIVYTRIKKRDNEYNYEIQNEIRKTL